MACHERGLAMVKTVQASCSSISMVINTTRASLMSGIYSHQEHTKHKLIFIARFREICILMSVKTTKYYVQTLHSKCDVRTPHSNFQR